MGRRTVHRHEGLGRPPADLDRGSVWYRHAARRVDLPRCSGDRPHTIRWRGAGTNCYTNAVFAQSFLLQQKEWRIVPEKRRFSFEKRPSFILRFEVRFWDGVWILLRRPYVPYRN